MRRDGSASVEKLPRDDAMRFLWAMRSVSVPFLSLAALAILPPSMVACLQQVSTGTGTTDTTATTSTAAATSTSTAVPVGSACGTDPQTQVTLCEGIDLCPSLTVDQDVLPGCGFRIHAGAVIDLECLCTDSLCPIGVADSCDEATQLLTEQTSLGVCEQAAEGHCVQVVAPGATSPASTSAPATTTSTCDKTCESECAGEPDCLQLCGC
jgi:hypothetical protein